MKDTQPRGLGRLFYGPWNQDMPENAWAFNLTNIVPARNGELSQRFELRNGDCTTKYIPGNSHPIDWGCYNDRERAEVRHSMWKPGADKWIGFSIRVDNEWERHARGHCTSLFQIKQHENNVKQSNRPETKLGQYNKGHYIGGHAVMHGEICGDNFGVVIKHSGYEDSKLNGWSHDENVRYGKINNIAGEWNDVVLHWDTSDYRNGNSVLEVYLNGQLAGKWDNVTNNFFPDDYTFKYGLYRSYMKKHGVTSRTQVVYFDEVRTGRSFDAVNPATNRPLD